MDLVVNHTSDEHPWFVESRASKDSPKRDWYFWREQPNNWTSAFSGSAWELDEATGEHYLHVFSRKQPDLNWENPEVRRGRLLDDELLAGPRGRRLPHGRHQLHLQGARPARRRDRRRLAAAGRRALRLRAAHPRVPAGDAPRGLRRAATRCSTWARCRASRSRRRRLFTDPARDEVDMVFQFEHVNLDQAGTKWNPFPLDLRDLKRSFGRWQEGLAEAGWNSLYWNNHDQPRIVSRWGDDGEHRVRSAKALGTLLHLHRGTPYVYQGEELGMTNMAFGSIDDFRRHRGAQPLRRGRRGGGGPRRGARVDAADEPRQRAHADAVGRLAARGLHDGRAVDRGQPEPRGDQRGRGDRRPRLGLPPLPAADRAAPHRAGGRARRLHDAARGRPAGLRVHARARGHRAARGRQRLRRARERGRHPGRRGVGGRGARAHERRARAARARARRRGRRGSTAASGPRPRGSATSRSRAAAAIQSATVVATLRPLLAAQHLLDHRGRTCASCPASPRRPRRNGSEPTIDQPIGSTK